MILRGSGETVCAGSRGTKLVRFVSSRDAAHPTTAIIPKTTMARVPTTWKGVISFLLALSTKWASASNARTR
jgi:hypothetical protein